MTIQDLQSEARAAVSPTCAKGAHPHRSASQIETFRKCPRKWALQKIDRVPMESSTAQDKGKLGHLYMEWWLREGMLPNAAAVHPPFLEEARRQGTAIPSGPDCEIARTAKALIVALKIPPRHPTIEIEKFWRLRVAAPDPVDAVEILGYCDVFAHDPASPNPPAVLDHKFVSSLSWAKTGADLLEDVQATCYAVYAMVSTGKPTCSLQWNYGVKGSTKTALARTVATAEGVAEPWAQIVESCRAMNRIEARCDADYEANPTGNAQRMEEGVPWSLLNVEGNPSHCPAYGGCPYREICGDQPPATIASLFHMKGSNL